MQGCDAALSRLTTACGRCPVGQPPASSSRRHTRVVTDAGKAACAGKKRMRGLLALHLCIHGCTACSASVCMSFYTPRAVECATQICNLCKSFPVLATCSLVEWQLVSPPRQALGFGRRQGEAPCLWDRIYHQRNQQRVALIFDSLGVVDVLIERDRAWLLKLTFAAGIDTANKVQQSDRPAGLYKLHCLAS